MNQDIVIKFYLKINPEVSKKNCLDALKIAKKKNIQNKMKRISSGFLKEKYWKLFYLIGFFSKDNFIYEHGVLHGYSLLSFAFGKFYFIHNIFDARNDIRYHTAVNFHALVKLGKCICC